MNTLARYRIGDTQLHTGLLAYQQPQGWTLPQSQFGQSIEQARAGAEGLVFYPYLYLFSRGEDDFNLPAGSAALLQDVIATDDTLVDTPEAQTAAGVAFGERLSNWAGDYGATVLGVAAVFIAGLALGARAWRRRAAPPALDDDAPARRTDWRRLAREVDRDIISLPTFKEVSAILRATGAAKVAAFRRARVLDLVSLGPTTVNEVVDSIGACAHDARTLRYLEESNLLGYVAIDGKQVSITEQGQRFLEQWRGAGYSGEYLAFLEARLSENLVLACPHCGTKTLGHWFWDHFQCLGCHRHLAIGDSPRIRRKTKETADSIHSLFHEGRGEEMPQVRRFS